VRSDLDGKDMHRASGTRDDVDASPAAPAPPAGTSGVPERDPLSQRIAAYIDTHHPKLGSRLLKLRWGGLRTIEPSTGLGAALVGVGTGAGLGVRRLAGRRTCGRARVPLALAAPGGALAAWMAVWRWDAARWRRRNVALMLDLTPDRVDELVERLHAEGLAVERWTGPRTIEGEVFGISCRARDLRRVNAAIDAVDAVEPVRA
jgi:hypothetical protein